MTMKSFSLFVIYFLSFQLVSVAQSYVNLSDNLDLNSNTNYKISAGNYTLQDPAADGLIRINHASNVVIDGDSVEADGVNYSGYAIKIDSSDHISIKNFTSLKHFKYAVYVSNSHHISILNCNFSYNKVDSSGWIDVWAGYNNALGGGVLFYQCDSIRVYGSLMKYQNDGVALYNSKRASISYCDFAWNTSYGIRMFYTDSSYIGFNNCAHVNRPLTDPSDCAALLMIVSNANHVTYNDLTYSGDGVFLGQYQHSTTPNNNLFNYNDCSGSPHNAIEATFAGGNVYKHNVCNMSQYGLWLGYSFNSIIDSNLILYNTVSGVAIDRGFNNQLTHNWIEQNPQGIELWEGTPATGYTGYSSHDYLIDSNYFEGNTLAIRASGSEKLKVKHNRFIKNYAGILFQGNASLDTIANNHFDQSLTFDLSNNSTYDILAKYNKFTFNDTNYIAAKINDKLDTAGHGMIYWKHPEIRD